MQQEELGTTIAYPVIHDMEQHDNLGATVKIYTPCTTKVVRG